MAKRRNRKRRVRKTVFEIPIRQGVVHVTANNEEHAKRQARSLERDLSRYWVRSQVEVQPGVFILGHEAKVKAGMEVWTCSS